jgi:hypothetical protein
MPITRLASTIALTLTFTAVLATSVSGSHSWGVYHWARTSNPFTLTVVNSTTSDWDPYVAGAVADWNASAVLDMVQEIGDESSRTRRQCSAPTGQIRICNLAYGNTGWLGIAGISIDPSGHITRGYTKLNDTYFASSFYDTNDWKRSVTCQELGHDLGLDHQDEDFNNTSLFTCMDYQNPPFPFPNTHDYGQLQTIYGGHTDSYNSYASATSGGGEEGGSGGGTCNAPPGKGCNKSGVGQDIVPPGWGISLGRRGQHETFERVNPDGSREVTHVSWAE